MNLILFTLSSISGALATWYLVKIRKVDPILSSALLGLIFSFGIRVITTLFDMDIVESSTLSSAFFGATFIGMTSPKIEIGTKTILISAIIYSIFLWDTEHYFSEYGGGLGTSAFISVICGIGIRELIVGKMLFKEPLEKTDQNI